MTRITRSWGAHSLPACVRAARVHVFGALAEITSRFHRRERRGHEEQKDLRRFRRFTQIRHSGVVIPSSFDIRHSAFGIFKTSVISVASSPRRMEPQGCERHRWVKPRGRNEWERVKSIRPTADVVFPSHSCSFVSIRLPRRSPATAGRRRVSIRG
jgi:hypothetical protein